MRVYRFLGTKSGLLDKVQIPLITASACAGMALNSIIVTMTAPLCVFIATHLLKTYWFDGREEWPVILMRMLLAPKGSWNLNERDYIRLHKNPGD